MRALDSVDSSHGTFSLRCLDAPVAVAAEREARRPRLAGALLRTQPDERLARLAGEGSEQAFEELVRRHRANLVTFAGTIAPSGYADDVVQDAMVRAQTALLRGDRPDYAKAWLYAIVRNTALNQRRGHRDHDQIDETIDGVEQPPQVFERRSEIKSLVVALNDLPKPQRDALVQRELEGRGHDEIAATLQVSPGAVRQLIHRARTTLRAGAGAVVPAFMLRAAVLGSGSEQAIGGAAAAGLGATGIKLGLGALLATGAIVGGVEVGKEIRDKDKAEAPVAVESSGAGQAGAAESATPVSASTSERGVRAADVNASRTVDGEQRGDRPPPDQFGQHHQGGQGGAHQGGQQPPPQGGSGGAGQYAPPQGGTAQYPSGGGHTGGGQKPPPPPPPQ